MFWKCNKAVPIIKRWWNDTAVPDLKTHEELETIQEGEVL